MKKTILTLLVALMAVLPSWADGHADLTSISSFEGVQEVKLGKEMIQMALASGMDMGDQIEGLNADMLKNVDEMSIYLTQNAKIKPLIEACVNEVKNNKSYETFASIINEDGTMGIFAYTVEGGYDELLMFIYSEQTGAMVMRLSGQFTPEMLQSLVKSAMSENE
ncbi:MAG: DUF4252 domain-containing protein [Prevotellamassilia sp.]|nr:DUF4252 domain-containing protein [Prevotellamassilia sp.]